MTIRAALRAQGLTSLVVPAVLLFVSTSLQFARLESAPRCGLELAIGTDVRSFIRSRYVDRGGRRLPLFTEGLDKTFHAPVPVYAAVVADAVTSSPSSFRIAAAAVAVASVLLTYVAAKCVFGGAPFAAMAAAFVAATPAYVAMGRTYTPEGIWHVPFVCGWLLSLAGMLRRREQFRRPLAICIALIAASVYSQPSAAIASFILVALTAMARSQLGPLSWRDLRPPIVIVAVLSAPLLLWFIRHPSTYADTFGSWLLHLAHVRSPSAWWLAASHPDLWTEFSGTYWNFFSPTHLLVNDTSPALTGAFLLPVGVLAAIGVYTGLREPADDGFGRLFTKVTLVGVLCLPMSAAYFLDRASIDRALAIVPMVALLAANGAKWLWTSPRKRAICGLLVAAGIAQFAFWYTATVYPIQGPRERCEASDGFGFPPWRGLLGHMEVPTASLPSPSN